MAREARRVPAGWKHPKNKSKKFIPLFEGENGFPQREGYMPTWSDKEATHFMMYETTTEGTPISPAFATAGGLADWLEKNRAFAYAGLPATKEQWLRVITGECIFTLAIIKGKPAGVALVKR